MKLLTKFFVAAACCAAVAGCSDTPKENVNQRLLTVTDSKKNGLAEYTISKTDFHVVPVEFVVTVPFVDSTSVEFKFETLNSVNWTILPGEAKAPQPALADFVKVSPMSGFGTGSFVVEIAENKSGHARSEVFRLNLVERDSLDKVIGQLEHTFIIKQD